MEATHLAVARFLKPHGLAGAVLAVPLTDEPEEVFAVGRRLWRVDEAGRVGEGALVIRRSRPFKQGWLLEFEDVDTRSAVEPWAGALVGMPREELRPPGPDAMYLHEVIGAEVVVGGRTIGVVRDLIGSGAASFLAVQSEGREHLIPFRRPIVREMDRAGRRVVVDPPPGLLDL